MVSEDCGYSVESVAVHISLERILIRTYLPCRVPDLYDAIRPRGFDSLNPHLTQQVVNRIRFIFYVCWSLIVCEDGEGFFVAFLETKPTHHLTHLLTHCQHTIKDLSSILYRDFKKSANTLTNTIANTPPVFANTQPTHFK